MKNTHSFLRTTAFLTCLVFSKLANASTSDTGVGYLKVASTTQQAQWGDGTFYYPHTGYRIFDSHGREMQWVENHNTSIDEIPQKVELAPGSYVIWAQSDRDGYAKFPVTIKLGRVTSVDLENKSRE